MSFTRLLTGSAAFAVAATIAHAADMPVKAPAVVPVVEQASGYIEVYGGWASTKFKHTVCAVGGPCFEDRFDFDGWVLGGAGRANAWIMPAMSVQLDVQGEGTSYKNDFPFLGGGHVSAHSYLVGGHASWRNSQTGLLGVFVGAGDAGSGFGQPAVRHVVAGGEAQLYWNQLTLYVQGGYDTVAGRPASDHLNAHAWFVRGTGRYFFTPNTLLEGTVLYANGEIEYETFLPASGPTNGFKTWLWEAKLEHRFAATPFSLFVKYRGSETKFDPIQFGSIDELKVTDRRVLLGLKLLMGTDTLQRNDRNGATLDIIDPLGIQTGPLMIGGTQALRP